MADVYNDYMSDIEDLLMDFLIYRKTRKGQGYKDYKDYKDYDLGKGWPYYKDMQIQSLADDELYDVPMPKGGHGGYLEDSGEYEPYESLYVDGCHQKQEKYAHEICNVLSPIVIEVLKTHDWHGEKYMDSGCHKHLCDKVIDKASGKHAEIKEIAAEKDKSRGMSRYHMLCGVVEIMVLHCHKVYILEKSDSDGWPSQYL